MHDTGLCPDPGGPSCSPASGTSEEDSLADKISEVIGLLALTGFELLPWIAALLTLTVLGSIALERDPRHTFASGARVRRLAARRDLRPEDRSAGVKYVEVRGFEPLASAVRRQRSTGLSYTPGTSGSVAEGPDEPGGGGIGGGGTSSIRRGRAPKAPRTSSSSGRYSDWNR